MRVTMHTTTSERCGIADYTRDLLAALRPAVEVGVVPIDPPELNPLRMLAVARRLNAGTIAHVQHNYGFWGRGSLSYRVVFDTLQRAVRVPTVLTAHSVQPVHAGGRNGTVRSAVARGLGLHRYLDRGTFARARRIIVHSRRHVELLVERGIPAHRIVRIPPGVPGVVLPAPAEVERMRRAWGLHGKRILGLFGFIQPNKRYELVVRALAELDPDVALVMVGGIRTAEEQWYDAEVRALARSLGVEDRVHVTGFLPREQLGPALAAVDLFVLPYTTDNSVSYSARLCLAYEKPVLASAIDAFCELKDEYGCVELFGSNLSEMTTQIGRLLDDEDRRAALGEGARAFRRHWSWERVAAETLGVYRALAAHAARGLRAA